MSEDCIFCKIRDRAIPAKRVFEDDLCFAFEDIDPKAPTHILVCPKEHLASLAEADASHEGMLGRLCLVAAKLAEKNGEESYRTVVNTGAGSGQSVFHVHMHLLAGRTLNWPPG